MKNNHRVSPTSTSSVGGLDVTAGNEDEEESDGDSLFGDEDGKSKDNHQTAEEV